MGKPVTLDSDDVEVLLNAAAATAKIESLLMASRNDPAMIRLQAKGQIEQALDRCNRARGQAIKPDELKLPPVESVGLSIDERASLERLDGYGARGFRTDNPGLYATLFLAGFAVRAQCNEHIRWGDGGDPLIESLMWQRVRITERGKQWLEQHR